MNYLSNIWSIIGYNYTPNQENFSADLQGNVYPRTITDPNPANSALMTDFSAYYALWTPPYFWNHVGEKPFGGSVHYLDGHVVFEPWGRQLKRHSVAIGGSLYDLWW